jgi:hypothetical protein
MRPYQADTCCRYSVFLDEMTDCANGAGTARSYRRQDYRVYIIFFQKTGNFFHRRFEVGTLVGAADRIMKVRQAADNTFINQFYQPVDWKNDITVSLKSAAVETRRTVGHDQVVDTDVTRDDSIKIIGTYGEWPVGSAVHPGSRDYRYPPFIQRRSAYKGIRIEFDTGQTEKHFLFSLA